MKPGETVSMEACLRAPRSRCSQQLRSGHLGSGASVWGSQYPPWTPGNSSHFSGSGALSPRARPPLSEASKCPSKTMHCESGFLLNENKRIHSKMICLQSRASLTGGNTPSRPGLEALLKDPCLVIRCQLSSTLLAGPVTLGMITWTLGAESLFSGVTGDLWGQTYFFFYMDILKSCQIVLMKYSGSGGTRPRLKTRWW